LLWGLSLRGWAASRPGLCTQTCCLAEGFQDP
jgi:hypothetical protein